MRRQARKRSRPPSPEAADDLDRVIIQDSNLNVSAGGVFYEKAKSRRQRHRLALMSSDQSSDAVALGKSINRGPGGTADLPGDIANERAGGKIGEDGAEKVRELIDSGRAAMAAKSRSSRKSFTSRTIPSISRMRLNKSHNYIYIYYNIIKIPCLHKIQYVYHQFLFYNHVKRFDDVYHQ